MSHSILELLCVLSIGTAISCTTELSSGQDDASGNGVDAGANATDGSVSDGNGNSPDGGFTSPDANTAVSGCSAGAIELISLVNVYRGENGLPTIPASPSLCTVGAAHVVDLNDNSPDAPAGCNMHSWSDQGNWSACCYTSDHAQAQCMWDKPRELTNYPGNGYENAAGGGGSISPSQALNLWKNSTGHREVILNQGIWANQTWNALGVGIENGYAVLWFGSSVDPASN